MSPSPILAIIVVAGTLVPALAQAAECTCEHLPALQAELRNAQRLQAAFRGRIAALQAMGPENSRTNFAAFVKSGEPARGLTSLRCVLNGVETGRGSTNRMSVPIPPTPMPMSSTERPWISGSASIRRMQSRVEA